jgi:hypothetical protein
VLVTSGTTTSNVSVDRQGFDLSTRGLRRGPVAASVYSEFAVAAREPGAHTGRGEQGAARALNAVT